MALQEFDLAEAAIDGHVHLFRCMIGNPQCQELISHVDLHWKISQAPFVRYLIPLQDHSNSFAPLEWPFEKTEITHDTIYDYYLEASSNRLQFEIKYSGEDAEEPAKHVTTVTTANAAHEPHVKSLARRHRHGRPAAAPRLVVFRHCFKALARPGQSGPRTARPR
jgi:hypothetical protein